MRKCPKCQRYTFSERCPECGEKTVSPHPPRYVQLRFLGSTKR
ncbi:MAG TPA: ribosome biogenesis protein [Candidatus Korarchaeota archaeon]|nr:MAG: ribosome biogenesis protein [Candidatus Korarchaeota archaeon]HDD69364.1 ribosome biogenesis protein [Candidatus Korarchaeota archaeon]